MTPTALVQDISEFKAILWPIVLDLSVQRNMSLELAKKAFIWIVREEIELCHMLFDPEHTHNDSQFDPIYCEIKRFFQEELRSSLSVTFCHYVAVPQVYSGSNLIRVIEDFGDLYIFYASKNVSSVLYPYFKRKLKN